MIRFNLVGPLDILQFLVLRIGVSCLGVWNQYILTPDLKIGAEIKLSSQEILELCVIFLLYVNNHTKEVIL
jgi:hypothetical protein